jgi:long-chain acyl-CoA synthetase
MLPFDAARFSGKTAIITDSDATLTYGDMDRFSGSLSGIIRERCLVFCLCQNTTGSLCGYLSFLSNGVVPVMLDAKIDSGFLSRLLGIYRPRYIWLPDSRTDASGYGECVFSGFHYSLLKLPENELFPLYDGLAVLLPTSGSTGSSRFVRISRENLVSNAASISAYLSIDGNERPVTTLPMNYSFGLSVINSHVMMGTTVLLTSRSLMEKEFWTFLKENHATSLSGVPYTYKILDKLRFREMDLPSLKTLTQAGGRLNEELNRKFAEFCLASGKKFFIMYGQTEATARISYLPPEYSLDRLGSIGKAVPGGKIILRDEQGAEITEPDTVGEIVYTGKNVSLGYAGCIGDLAKGDVNHGVLHTGDLARKDRDGFFYIVGRKGRFIKMFGNRISLDETERLLDPVFPDCACTGRDDSLVIHMTDRTRMDEVKNYLSGRTGIHPSALSFRHHAEIPRNSFGKTDYSKLDLL